MAESAGEESTGEESAAGSEPDGSVSLLDMVRWSYGEVLDATKHQDDKIGRFLAAIAFLTTGGITLLFRTDLVAAQWQFGKAGSGIPGHGAWPLLAYADFVFFACVISAVALLLISLSAPLRMPGAQARYGPSIDGSRLFFTHISRSRADEWLERWVVPSDKTVRAEIYRQYVNETHNLAERAALKYRHTREASGLFSLGLSFLAASLTLAVSASLNHAATAAPYTHLLGLALGIVFGGHAWLQIHAVAGDQQVSAQLRKDAESGMPSARKLWDGARGLDRVRWTLPLYVLSLTVPGNPWLERVAGGVGVALAVSLSLVFTRERWIPRTGVGRVQVERLAQFGVGPLLLGVGSLVVGGAFPLLTAALVPVALSWLLNARRVPRLRSR